MNALPKIKLTKAQMAFLRSVEDQSIWSKPARAAQRPMESRMLKAGLLAGFYSLTDAGRAAIAKLNTEGTQK